MGRPRQARFEHRELDILSRRVTAADKRRDRVASALEIIGGARKGGFGARKTAGRRVTVHAVFCRFLKGLQVASGSEGGGGEQLPLSAARPGELVTNSQRQKDGCPN
jgi:hypothetical protein